MRRELSNGFTNWSSKRLFMNADEVNRQIGELERIRLQTRRFRLLTIAALIAIVVASVSAIINSFYSLALAGPRQDAFVRHLGVNLQKDFMPIAERIAGRSLQRLKPAVEAALQRLNARSPEIAEVTLRELDLLGKELPVRAERILDETFGKTLREREDKLRKMHPGLDGGKVAALLGNLSLEAQEQLAKTGESVFSPHLNSIQSILADLETIKNSEPVEVKKDVDSWQMAFLFMDVFVHEFEDLGATETAQREETNHEL
jgi:hypothetical protein